MTTTIEWTMNADGTPGSTWGILRGCSRISPGCGGGGSFSGTQDKRGGCYAEAIAARFSGFDKHGEPLPFHGFATRTEHGPRWTGKIAVVWDKLIEPITTRKPTTFFISMSDLFHEKLTNEEIAAIIGVMAACPRHLFQVLTKRSSRMVEWFAWLELEASRHGAATALTRVALLIGYTLKAMEAAGIKSRGLEISLTPPWPLTNLHLGVSVEAAAYKHRLDNLRECPAAVRFCSLEPLLDDLGTVNFTNIDQAIVGAESGRSARPMHEQWVRSIRDQAIAQGTAFFYKQIINGKGRKVSLPMLDGRQWTEMPKQKESK